MSAEHRRYILLEQGVGAAVFNFALNAGIAWLLFRHLDRVPLWGEQSIAGDTVATAVILPVLTCLIVTRMTRGRLRSGRLPPLAWTRATHPVLGLLPRATGWRAVVLAAACMTTLAPVTLWALGALAVADLSLGGFVLFKAGWAAGAAALVTPVVALWAIADGGTAVRR